MAATLAEQHERVERELNQLIPVMLFHPFHGKERLRNRISVLLARSRNLTRLRFERLEKLSEQYDGEENHECG